MSFLPRFSLAFLVTVSLAGSAHALCPSTMTTDARITCLSLVLGNALAEIDALQARVDQLEADSVPGLGDYLTVDTTSDSILFEGANVYIQSGSGATNGAVNGLGNLVIGYDENLIDVYGPSYENDRSGSHNLVLGMYNSYSSYGGILAAYWSSIGAEYATVLGSQSSNATGPHSVVLGGYSNQATGDYAVVAGGYGNSASGDSSSVMSGAYNASTGLLATVSAGYDNWSTGTATVISGGGGGQATANGSVISGGYYNTSSGFYSTVAGGALNTASGNYSTVLGGYYASNSTEFGTTP